jgi:putative nucleotidyltransferase with HDIG domain
MQDALTIVKQLLTQRIESGKLDMPLLPKVAGAVIALTQDENSDMSKLAELIQRDQSLASRIMKIANSPAYRGVNQMSSLQQAISRMGMNVIAEVALAASVGAKVFQAKGYESDVANMWQHSLASSSWAKEIARIRRRNVESAFMCGLLHQIGKPMVLQAIVEITHENPLKLTSEDIHKMIQEFYVDVGITLGKDWELPNNVVESIEFHQDYESAPKAQQEAMICCAANQMASLLLADQEINLEDIITSDVMEKLNLYEDDLQKLVDKSSHIKQVVEGMSL